MTKHLLAALICAGALAACNDTAAKAPDVSQTIRQSLDQAGYKDVSVSQDRDKGVITLDGHVATDADKAKAESIAKSGAAGQVVADQIAVLPPANEGDAKKVASALDDGIESNMKALSVQQRWKDISYSVKEGVVTLTGSVDSEAARATIARAATSVPNVTQVVNELQIKNRKASSSGSGS
jgi:hyperosmotically inducible periplasmic protein